MIPKRYLVWSKREIDLREPFQRKWYIKQVLTHGRAEDVASLDWDEIKRLLPELDLPAEVRALWEAYFHAGGKRHHFATACKGIF
ncbi:MAG TPA: hypothetical protein PKX93_07520 [bacterium]|nr:hypothetical protein [bacterium]HOL67286.1 hypothetical protein [bacterium]HPP12559.1 hypothetical protein [bacterium]